MPCPGAFGSPDLHPPMEQIELKVCAGLYPPAAACPRFASWPGGRGATLIPCSGPWLAKESGLYTRRTSGRFVTENQDMIRAVKSRLVREHTRDFLNKMGRLGFTHPEILKRYCP